MVIVILRIFDVPYVPDIDRVEAMALGQDFWQGPCYGFKDEPDLPQALMHWAQHGLELEVMNTPFFLGRETLIPRFGNPPRQNSCRLHTITLWRH